MNEAIEQNILVDSRSACALSEEVPITNASLGMWHQDPSDFEKFR